MAILVSWLSFTCLCGFANEDRMVVEALVCCGGCGRVVNTESDFQN